MKIYPCLYIFEYSPDVLKKKTTVLDAFNTVNFMNINIQSSPPEIWIVVALSRFLAKRLPLVFANAFKIVKERQLLLSQ